MLNIAMLYASWRAEGEEHSWPMAVHYEFQRLGYTVRDYNLYHANGAIDPRIKSRRYSDEGLNGMYADIRAGWKPDIIFHMDYGQHHSPRLDKKLYPDAIWVMESGDDPQAGKYNMPKSPRFDFALTPHLPYVNLYKQYGATAHWWAQACDIDYLNQVQDVPIVFGAVSTCGSRGNGLTEKIKEALGDQFTYDRYYYNKDHTKRLKSGKLIFHHSQYSEIGRRVMEGAGCQKLVICDRLPEDTGLSSLFKEGEEIIFFDNADDAIDKIRYYLSHDEERERIALNGYNKVIANHTVRNRVDQLLHLCCEVKPSLRERL